MSDFSPLDVRARLASKGMDDHAANLRDLTDALARIAELETYAAHAQGVLHYAAVMFTRAGVKHHDEWHAFIDAAEAHFRNQCRGNGAQIEITIPGEVSVLTPPSCILDACIAPEVCAHERRCTEQTHS